MKIIINTGTAHEAYNAHMRSCFLYAYKGAMVDVQVIGFEPELWISETGQEAPEKRVRIQAVRTFNKAEACNPYAVEAFGKESGRIER